MLSSNKRNATVRRKAALLQVTVLYFLHLDYSQRLANAKLGKQIDIKVHSSMNDYGGDQTADDVEKSV
jgi:hypothetical protein